MADPIVELTIQPKRLDLSETERDLLSEELRGLINALPPQSRTPYQVLAESVKEASVPPQQIRLLESVLELVLGSGKTRHSHRAEGERVLQGLFKRTARGQATEQQIAQVNRALEVLKNQKLEKIEASSSVPGHYTLTINTSDMQLQLVIHARGIAVDKTTI